MPTKPNTLVADSTSLEKTLFEYLCLIQCVLLICLMVQDAILMGPTWMILPDTIVSGIGLLFFYLSRYKGIFNPLRIPLIIFLMISLGFFWVALGGYNGLMAVIALAIGLVIIIIAPGRLRLLYSSVIPLEMIILTLLQSTGIIQVGEYPPQAIPVNYILFALSSLCLLYLLKVEFDKSRDKAENQNLELNQINNVLQNVIDEKEDYIIKLNSTQNQLIASEKMATLGRLTAGLAHELNNPLNYIGGSVDPILRDLMEIEETLTATQKNVLENNINEVKKLLGNIKEGSQRSTDVINNLLRISPRNDDKKESAVDIVLLTQRTCTLIQNAFPWIRLTFFGSDEIMVLANPTEINQVLLNILNNAAQAIKTDSSPEIEVTATTSNKNVNITFKDNGKGVSSKDIPHIFEPFFTTKEEGHGTGLGLYISYGIVKKHGGTLSYLETRKGACFNISLPLA
jgi:signal transduction histidine kinase